MVDTLSICFDQGDFQVRHENLLSVKQGKRIFVLWNGEEGKVRGSIAYRRQETFSLRIMPFQKNFPRVFAVLTFSVPRVIRGSNVYPASCLETKEAVHAAQDFLEETGFHVDIWRGKISRLDLFKDIQIVEPFTSYCPLFARNDLRNGETKSYKDTGFLHKNKRVQMSIYDKSRECHLREIPVDYIPTDLMRFEYRMMRAVKVANELGLKSCSVRQLIDRYDELDTILKRFWHKHQFQLELPEIGWDKFSSEDVSHIQAEMKIIQVVCGQKWIQPLERVKLWQSTSAEDREFILHEMKRPSNGGSTGASRYKQTLKEVALLVALVERDPASRRWRADLYQEVRRKLLGDFQTTPKTRRSRSAPTLLT